MNSVIQVVQVAALLASMLVVACLLTLLWERLEARHGRARAGLLCALMAIAAGPTIVAVITAGDRPAEFKGSNNTVVLIGSLQRCQ